MTTSHIAIVRGFVFGCGSLSAADIDGAFAVLDAYRDAGGRVLDTARVYGTSESVVGEWLAARGCHGEMAVVTKGAHPGPDWSARLSRDAIMQDVAASLAMLGVFEVDGYLLHRDDPERDVHDIARTLTGIVQMGYARRVGVSNWTKERVLALSDAMRDEGGAALAIVSNYGGLATPTAPAEWPGTRSTTDALLKLAGEREFDVLGWSALSAGFFADDRSAHPEFAGDENDRRRAALRVAAAEAGVAPIEVLARALATMDPRFVPVFSTRSPERVHQVCRAAADESLDLAVSTWMSGLRGGLRLVPAW